MSDSNVADLTVITTLDMDPDRVLQQAVGKMDEVVIIGFDKDGNEYFASSKSDAGDILFHLERAKHKLMAMFDEDER